MANQKSKLHGTIGFLLILTIGFGFGLLLMVQSRSTAETAIHDDHSPVAEESMPGMDMPEHEMAVTLQDNSPFPLLTGFFLINLAIIFAALILKRVRSKRKAKAHRALPILEFEGGIK